MISFEAAEKIVRGVPPSGETERINLSDSLFSVLAEDIIADMNMPPFNKSAVDGFACLIEDLDHPLHCIETIAAGNTPKNHITSGKCVRVMTGAEVPGGANCVVMLEDTQIDEKGNIIFTAQKTATNICILAEDVHEGEKLLPAGTILKPRHIPLLASMGYTHPLVYKNPTIGIISTGSELVDPSQKPSPGKIRNSNGPQLEAQCTEMNIVTENFGIVPDSRDELRRTILLSVSKHQVSILSGGVSVGDFDYAPEIIRELGFEIHFHGLNVKPGKRILFASKDKSYIFGLPGNPVSALVQFEMLVKPMLMKLQNAEIFPEMEKRILAEEYSVKNASRVSFVPVLVQADGSVKPVEYHGSAHIFAYATANGFMKIPGGTNKIEKGAFVDVRLV
jgi:molybdopterin molybdotransferase